MSLIHCSPLFLPLEPLPIMSPRVMRGENNNSSSKQSTASSSSVATPRSKTAGPVAATTRRKGKAATRRLSHPLSQTPTTVPVNAQAVPQIPTSLSLPEDLSSALSTTPETFPNEARLSSTCQEACYPAVSEPASQDLDLNPGYLHDSFDSQMQGSLTFTMESQPMDDLSSSQQQNA